MSLTAAPSRTRSELVSRFHRLDWSFPDSAPDPEVDIHPYPAKFIREIPAQALSLASKEGIVLDPFCGSGTTLVEATRQGFDGVGLDLNPIATLISRVKTSGWRNEDAALLERHKARMLEATRAGSPERLRDVVDEIPRLNHWFDLEAQSALAGATAYLQSLPAEDRWRERLEVALSSILVRASRQESDTRYAAIDKRRDSDAIGAWLGRAIDRVAKASFAVAKRTADGATAAAFTDDAANLGAYVAPGTVSAAVFSPPYPNAYEYWLYHKYRMYWLGFDPQAVRSREIGARPFYSGSGRLTEEDFGEQMAAVLSAVAVALKDDGIVVVVMGDSVIRGRYIDNAAVLSGIAPQAGLCLLASTDRAIRTTSRSFNQAVARAKREHVLLLARA